MHARCHTDRPGLARSEEEPADSDDDNAAEAEAAAELEPLHEPPDARRVLRDAVGARASPALGGRAPKRPDAKSQARHEPPRVLGTGKDADEEECR